MKFRERWISFLHKAATGTSRTRTLLTPVGIAIFAAFTTLFVLAALLVDDLLNLPSLPAAGWRIPVSISMAAVGLAVDSFSLVFFFIPLYILINVWELKAIEEPELVKRLGAPYIEYRKRTPMFLPRLDRRRD